MALLFDITAASNVVSIDKESRKGEAAFTVTNQSGRPIRGRAIVKATNPVAQTWLTIAGNAEHSFQTDSAQTYTVKINLPLDAPEGDYLFQLDMIDVTNPDETYTNGPAVKFTAPPAVVEDRKKPFPWWIIIAAIVVIVIIVGVIVGLATRPEQPVPKWAALPVEGGSIRLFTPHNISNLTDTISSFQATYPSMRVEHVLIPGSEYLFRLTVMIAAGDTPDVIWVNDDVFLNLSETGFLDLSPIFNVVEWTPGVVRQGPSGDINAVGNWAAMRGTCCSRGASALAMYLAYENDGVR